MTYTFKNQACFQKHQNNNFLLWWSWSLLWIISFSFQIASITKSKKVNGLTTVAGCMITITSTEENKGVSFTERQEDSKNALWLPEKESWTKQRERMNTGKNKINPTNSTQHNTTRRGDLYSMSTDPWCQ